MDDKIQRRPFARKLGKGRVQRGAVADIAIQHRSGLERLDQRRNALAERVALIGEREFRTGAVQRLRDAPGNGAFVRHAHDEAALAFHEIFERHAGAPAGCPILMAQGRGAENRQLLFLQRALAADDSICYQQRMGQLLVRDVPDEIVGALKTRAKRHGRSAEAEHRLILESALKPSQKNFWNRAERSRARTAKIDFGDSALLLREDRDSR